MNGSLQLSVLLEVLIGTSFGVIGFIKDSKTENKQGVHL